MSKLNQRSIPVQWQGQDYSVWVVDNFDGYLDAFALEVGGNLTDERCPFGVLLWPSSRSLADIFAEVKPLPEAKLIVELGCGVGFLSCVLAKIYPEAKIYACDYEESLGSFVEQNARAWGVEDRVEFRAIDWRREPPSDLLSKADLVVGADLFYDDSHLEHLPPFASQLLKAGGTLVLADPRRFRFSKALEELQKHFHLLEQREEDCALDKEGIEEFMIGAGYREQKISILTLSRI
ncbi:MAG: methyltransferase domain-containing protein [Oligoflexus sp.]|nr:methyltransferase domain-containing protein [Oligoflexus sp.]